jgi:NAD-dependent dihydropyrimidine dehydrogenase PreA subunit
MKRMIITINEELCDGCGNCVSACSEGALQIVDGKAKIVKEDFCDGFGDCIGGCPTGALKIEERDSTLITGTQKLESQLRNWPVQITLLPLNAPYYKNADLLVAADCCAYAYGSFHGDFIKGHTLAIGCPKLDDSNAYKEKLATILSENNIQSITVIYMEVPCCMGLVKLVEDAVKESRKNIPLKRIKIGIKGEVLQLT